jgi:hypothetical protein
LEAASHPTAGIALELTCRYKGQRSFKETDTYEKWEKEARLDIGTDTRTEVDGPQESAGSKNSQEAKPV